MRRMQLASASTDSGTFHQCMPLSPWATRGGGVAPVAGGTGGSWGTRRMKRIV